MRDHLTMLWTAYDRPLAAHGARYSNSAISVIYTETGLVGVGKVGKSSWLQYAVNTYAAVR